MDVVNHRVALVTGATSGIGEACARALAAAGARVLLVGRRQDRLDALVGDLGADTALAVPLDVQNRKLVDETLGGLPAGWGAVDILVNGAGLALGLERAHEANPLDWETMIGTNVSGLVHVTRAVLPGMVQRNRGHIVNMSSVAGSYPYPGGNVYGATKAFVTQFSLNLRADVLGTAVRVTSIEPGMVESEFALVRMSGDKAKADAVYKGMTPMTPADIASAVMYCVNVPAHVNVNRLELMATDQAFAPFAVSRHG